MKRCYTCKKSINEDRAYAQTNDEEFHCYECSEELFPEFMGWALIEVYPDQIHVRPINEGQHNLDGGICSCEPRKEEEDGVTLWIHSSYDGREALEIAKKILNL